MTRKSGDAEYLGGALTPVGARLAYGLSHIIEVLKSRGVGVDQLLRAAGIPRFALDEPEYRITLAQELQFVRLAVPHLDPADGGLEVGRRFHLNTFGVLGLAGSSCETLLEMFQLVCEYPALTWGLFEFSIWREAGQGIVRFEDAIDLGPDHDFLMERDIACVAMLSWDVLGDRFSLSEVRFRHKGPADPSRYERYFRCPVRFLAGENGIVFDSALWDFPLPQANEMSRRFFEAQCRRMTKMLESPLDYADIVRRRLKATVPIPSLKSLAASLHLTQRTLQRRLADEGVSFSTLLREAREEKAREYLARGGMTIDAIAGRLGFQDAVAFSHAFKSWTGRSPGAFRRARGKLAAE